MLALSPIKALTSDVIPFAAIAPPAVIARIKISLPKKSILLRPRIQFIALPINTEYSCTPTTNPKIANDLDAYISW
ncbi:Uncharacterised protein, partial [Metamycoplasma alkalescens]